MSETSTLHGLLAAIRAQSLLDSAAAADGAAPTSIEVTAALAALGSPEFSPSKIALLCASLAGFEVEAAALRMTPSQARSARSHPTRRGKSKAASESAPDGLGVADLDAMTADAWSEAARWLAEQAGYSVEDRPFLEHGQLLAWRGRGERADGENVIVCAFRLAPGAPLLDADMRRLVTAAANEPDARLVAFTTADATVGAWLVARAAGAELLDHAGLERLLAGLTTAYARERASQRDDAKLQAKAAAAARKKLIAALTAAEGQAKAPGSARAVSGRAAVRKAVGEAREARRQASQALLAWETLLSDWLATFGERPARDGSLPLLAEPQTWAELATRADHLKKPLVEALRALARTAGDGDSGYGAWRQAIGEELAARCSALLWRASMIDPAKWQDYAAAVTDLAMREASLADNAASHAATRAERAQSQMAERAGVV